LSVGAAGQGEDGHGMSSVALAAPQCFARAENSRSVRGHRHLDYSFRERRGVGRTRTSVLMSPSPASISGPLIISASAEKAAQIDKNSAFFFLQTAGLHRSPACVHTGYVHVAPAFRLLSASGTMCKRQRTLLRFFFLIGTLLRLIG
jgi:hypothetical protein